MTEAYLRPRTILETFARLYPDAWKQVDDLRANRKGLGGWPDWCFLPLAGAYAIVSQGRTRPSVEQVRHVGILGALAAWRVTQGIYRSTRRSWTPSGRRPSRGTSPPRSCSTCPSGASTSRPPGGPGRAAPCTASSPTWNTTSTTSARNCGSSSTSPARRGTTWRSCRCTWARAGSPGRWRRCCGNRPATCPSPRSRWGPWSRNSRTRCPRWSRWSCTSARRPPRSGPPGAGPDAPPGRSRSRPRRGCGCSRRIARRPGRSAIAWGRRCGGRSPRPCRRRARRGPMPAPARTSAGRTGTRTGSGVGTSPRPGLRC